MYKLIPFFIRQLPAIAFFLAIAAAGSCKKKTETAKGPVTVSYKEDLSDFANPERGFFRYTSTQADAFTLLDENEMKSWRTSAGSVAGAQYSFYSTLVFRYYILEGYTNKALPLSVLDNIRTDFIRARNAGVKLIPRFTYNVTPVSGGCNEGWICPPYGDAPLSIVLQQIAQLKPILQENADVIAVLQMGFVGVWGEGYYSDHFGDPSSNGQGKLLDNNWQDRNELLAALLDALPKNRMVQVRMPQVKQRYVYGIGSTVQSPALIPSEAFNESDKARIGFHNDCFLASADDYGTYEDLGNSSSPRQSANTALREYMAADSRYVAVGGETCDDTFSPQNDCETAGQAQTEMRRFHYSYLNSAYNNDVNNDWQTGGCMDEIKRSLGYRFVLTEASFDGSAKPGAVFSGEIKLENKGYAAAFNPRAAKLLLRNTKTKQETEFTLETDIRSWEPGEHSIPVSVTLPATLETGDYELFLFLPDMATSLADNPAYAVRLANENCWEAATGYNRLNATITVY